jgi:hypothetical protein
MRFDIIYPMQETIYGDSMKEAIKNYVKINRALRIREMIFTDQKNHMKAQMSYYKHDIRNKVGIDFYPVPSTYVNSLSVGLAPAVMPMSLPMVINIPNNL